MNDSRITRVHMLTDDARQILAELGEEVVDNTNLDAAQFFLRAAVRHLKILEAS